MTDYRGDNPTAIDTAQSPPVRFWLLVSTNGNTRGASLPIRWEPAATGGRIRGTVSLEGLTDLRTAETHVKVRGGGVETDFGRVDLRSHDPEVWLEAELSVTGVRVKAVLEMVPRDLIAQVERETFLAEQGRIPPGPVVELHAAGRLVKSNALLGLEDDRERAKVEAMERIRVEGIDKA